MRFIVFRRIALALFVHIDNDTTHLSPNDIHKQIDDSGGKANHQQQQKITFNIPIRVCDKFSCHYRQKSYVVMKGEAKAGTVSHNGFEIKAINQTSSSR
jgi:hypothetical protein